MKKQVNLKWQSLLLITISTVIMLGASASTFAQGKVDGRNLQKQAAALEAAGKYEQAAEAYDKAAKAFEAAGQSTEQIAALNKSAEMYEKVAEQLTKGGDAQNSVPKKGEAETSTANESAIEKPAHPNPQGPRPGKYGIYSYSVPKNPPIYLGHFLLERGGKYRVSTTSKADYYGKGEYSFNAATSTIEWLSGPFKDNGWGGEFTVEREGKTHKIRLKSSTIGTNSLD